MRFMTTDQLDEWNDLLDQINRQPGLSTGQRGAALIEALGEYEQAHVPWAAPALNRLAETGGQRLLKQRAKSTSTTLVAFSTAEMVKSTRIGIRTTKGFEQKLFAELSWAELEEHIAMLRQQARSLGVSLGLDRKVLKLRKQFPDSIGPGDACIAMGVTLEQFLGAA